MLKMSCLDPTSSSCAVQLNTSSMCWSNVNLSSWKVPLLAQFSDRGPLTRPVSPLLGVLMKSRNATWRSSAFSTCRSSAKLSLMEKRSILLDPNATSTFAHIPSTSLTTHATQWVCAILSPQFQFQDSSTWRYAHLIRLSILAEFTRSSRTGTANRPSIPRLFHCFMKTLMMKAHTKFWS